jgi:hypothetical protein
MSKAKPKLIIKLQQVHNLQILTLKLASICCLQNQKFATFATSKAEGGEKNIEPQMDSREANLQKELFRWNCRFGRWKWPNQYVCGFVFGVHLLPSSLWFLRLSLLFYLFLS